MPVRLAERRVPEQGLSESCAAMLAAMGVMGCGAFTGRVNLYLEDIQGKGVS